MRCDSDQDSCIGPTSSGPGYLSETDAKTGRISMARSLSLTTIASRLNDNSDDLEPESVLSASLELLYDYQPITLADAGSVFQYRYSSDLDLKSHSIALTLRTPDTHAQNWSLHASSI